MKAKATPIQAPIDPVDGTLYVIYEDGAVWAYTPHSEDRIAKGWRTLKGGPCPAGQDAERASS